MVRIPSYEAQQGLQVGGGPSLPGVDTTGARALQSVGGAVANLGGTLQDRQDRLQDDRDKAWFSKARADASVGWTERKLALKNGATGTDAAGFTDLANKEWSGYRAGVAKGAPSERAKGMFDQWADAFGANDAVDSIDFREKSLFAARGADFESAFEAHKKSVVLDPKQYDRAVALFEDDLEIAKSWMTPEQERAARDKGLAQLQSARVGELVRSDPAGFLASVGSSGAIPIQAGDLPQEATSLLNAIASTESPGYNVINGGEKFSSYADHPRRKGAGGESTAAGRYQFVKGTWDRAAKALGLTDFSPASQDKAAWWLAQSDYRANTGRDLSSDLKSGNIESVRRGLSTTWRGLADAPGKFKSTLSRGGSATPAADATATAPTALDDPRLSHLTADQLVAYRDDAASLLTKQETAQAAAMKAAYNQQFNGLMTGILDGQAGRADVQAARDSGWLTDYDAIKKANDAIDARDKKVVDAGRALGGVKLNQFSTDDKNAADAAVDLLTGQGVDPLVAVDQVYQSSGVVPPKAVQGLRGALAGGSAAAAESAMQVASSILASNANAFAGADGGEDVAKQANAFRHFTELGMQPSQAARRVTEMNTPEYRAKNAVGDKEAADFVKKLTPSDVSSAFELGGSWLGMVGLGQGAAEIGFTYEQRNAVLSDFTELAEQRFRETGDEEVAKAYAKQVMSATYGETEFAGRRIFMKFPPSRAYPPVPRADGTPSTDYVAEQAAAAVNAHLAGDLPSAFIAGTRPSGMVTEGNIDINHRPRVVNGDGSVSTVRSMSFNEDGQEILVPTVSEDGRIMTDDEAVAAYHATGRHLGKFNTPEQATAYAEQLHNQQASAADGPVKPADVILAPIPNITSRDWSEGKLPRYSVSYWREENGQRVFETVHGQAFSADPKLAEVASVDARAAWDAKAAAAKEKARIEEQALAAGEAAPVISGQPDWMNARGAEIAREGARMNPAPADEASALRDQLPELQRRAISAAITAIRNGASPDAITKRLRDAGVPASLWPDEVK